MNPIVDKILECLENKAYYRVELYVLHGTRLLPSSKNYFYLSFMKDPHYVDLINKVGEFLRKKYTEGEQFIVDLASKIVEEYRKILNEDHDEEMFGNMPKLLIHHCKFGGDFYVNFLSRLTSYQVYMFFDNISTTIGVDIQKIDMVQV